MEFNYFLPVNIVFGSGKVLETGELTRPYGKKALIVTGKSSAKKSGLYDKVNDSLKAAGLETALFDKVSQNPLTTTAQEGADFAKANGCDVVVAIGGGSIMDCAKAIAVMATNDGVLWDYVAVGSGKGNPIPNRPLPIIAITTTAGTGSETDNAGVITKEDTFEKAFIGSPSLFPYLAVVDPELMLSVPAGFTAFQGFDALFHSVEGYIAKGANLMSDMYALTAIENLAKYLPRAVKDGNDMEARTHVAFANTLSGGVMCLTLLTSEHGMEHALSAYHPSLPHGAGLIMISRAYFSYFIRKHACDERFIRMARALGMPEADKPEDFITALTRLQEACGVADLKMSDYGIALDECEKLMRNAREVMGIMFTSDRVQMSDAEIVDIYKESWK